MVNLILLPGPAVPPQCSDAVPSSARPDAQDAPLAEPLHMAIALQRPSQSDTPHRPGTDTQAPTQTPAASGFSQGHAEEEAAPVVTEVAL